MKLIDDIFKDANLRWKGEKIWAWIFLIIFHGSAWNLRHDITLMQYAVAGGLLHAILFTANGLKIFLERKIQPIVIESEKTNVSATA